MNIDSTARPVEELARSTAEVRVFDVAVPGIRELSEIALDALKFMPPLWFSSVFGHPWHWKMPPRRWSEYSLLSPWRPVRALRYLLNIAIPGLPYAPPPFAPPFVDGFFYQPTVILQRPDHAGSYTAFPDEAWFFVNGIMTNGAVAQVNAAMLADLFHRPITLIQNGTSGLGMDLLQCALGKQWRQVTEPAVKAMPVIYDALKSDKERVVVICHSQGTIVMSTVLDLLYRLTRSKAATVPSAEMAAFAGPIAEAAAFAEPEFIFPSDEPLNLRDFAPLELEELGELEVYCFATCADVLVWYRPPTLLSRPIPWIEHFGNEMDIVRLGMLAPNADAHDILVDGPLYQRDEAWGHLLNEHYLYPIEVAQRQGRAKGGRDTPAPFRLLNPGPWGAPQLYAYINGGSPP